MDECIWSDQEGNAQEQGPPKWLIVNPGVNTIIICIKCTLLTLDYEIV